MLLPGWLRKPCPSTRRALELAPEHLQPHSAASGISSGSVRTGAFASAARPIPGSVFILARWREIRAVGNGIEIHGEPFAAESIAGMIRQARRI